MCGCVFPGMTTNATASELIFRKCPNVPNSLYQNTWMIGQMRQVLNSTHGSKRSQTTGFEYGFFKESVDMSRLFIDSGPVGSALPLHGGTKCQLPIRSTSDPPKNCTWDRKWVPNDLEWLAANEAGFESMRKHSFLQHFYRAFEGDPENTGNAKPLAWHPWALYSCMVTDSQQAKYRKSKYHK